MCGQRITIVIIVMVSLNTLNNITLPFFELIILFICICLLPFPGNKTPTDELIGLRSKYIATNLFNKILSINSQ